MWIQDGGNRRSTTPGPDVRDGARVRLRQQTASATEQCGSGAGPGLEAGLLAGDQDELCRRARPDAELARPTVSGAFLTRFAASCTQGYRCMRTTRSTSIGQATSYSPHCSWSGVRGDRQWRHAWRPRLGKAIIGPDGKVIKLAPKKIGRIDVPPSAMRYIRGHWSAPR
jgi:hypothetical protein